MPLPKPRALVCSRLPSQQSDQQNPLALSAGIYGDSAGIYGVVLTNMAAMLQLIRMSLLTCLLAQRLCVNWLLHRRSRQGAPFRLCLCLSLSVSVGGYGYGCGYASVYCSVSVSVSVFGCLSLSLSQPLSVSVARPLSVSLQVTTRPALL
eukprot:2747488-Rhodomonas_salina.1